MRLWPQFRALEKIDRLLDQILDQREASEPERVAKIIRQRSWTPIDGRLDAVRASATPPTKPRRVRP